MKKSSLVYVFIIAIWLAVGSFFAYQITQATISFCSNTSVFLWKKIVATTLLWASFAVFMYFWLNAIKDLLFSIFYVILHKKITKKYKTIDKECEDRSKKVLLLYCTCNDFNAQALLESSKQNYENFQVVILDDSSKPEYISQIDNFAQEHNFEIVRRENHKGFKAGNLNNYLQGKTDYDYFVVLDSDEVIPSNFISKTLSYFESDYNIGAVQTAHIAKGGGNVFQHLLGMSVKSNGKICQIMKNFYGSSALFGHGMMLSKDCYEKVEGFPEVVAEDISISVKIRNAGLKIVFAQNIVCLEEFPTNYLALKKRQCKWTQGNVEYMKNYNKEISKSKMHWYEKLDLKLSHYSLPIIPVISIILVINSICLGFMNCYANVYGSWFFVLLTVFLLSPLIPDVFTYSGTKNFWLIIPYFVFNMITYASMAPMMIKTVVLGVFGKKAKFIITPKEEKHITFAETFKASWCSVLFGLIIAVATYFAYNNFIPTIMLTFCCVFCPFVILSANIQTNKKPKINSVIKDNLECDRSSKNNKSLSSDLEIN